jgi:hypothetical protein
MVLMLLHGTAQLIDLAFPQLLFPSLVFFFSSPSSSFFMSLFLGGNYPLPWAEGRQIDKHHIVVTTSLSH